MAQDVNDVKVLAEKIRLREEDVQKMNSIDLANEWHSSIEACKSQDGSPLKDNLIARIDTIVEEQTRREPRVHLAHYLLQRRVRHIFLSPAEVALDMDKATDDQIRALVSLLNEYVDMAERVERKEMNSGSGAVSNLEAYRAGIIGFTEILEERSKSKSNAPGTTSIADVSGGRCEADSRD